MFAQELEEEMERQLIYQNQKGYNFQALEFAMKKIHPEKYGDKIVQATKTEVKKTSIWDDLKNDSGVDLYSTTKKYIS